MAGCTPGIGPRSSARTDVLRPIFPAASPSWRTCPLRLASPGFSHPRASACRHQPRAQRRRSPLARRRRRQGRPSGRADPPATPARRDRAVVRGVGPRARQHRCRSPWPCRERSSPLLHANRIPPSAASTRATTQAGTFMVTSTCGGCDRRRDGPSGRSTRWATLHARCRGGERKQSRQARSRRRLRWWRWPSSCCATSGAGCRARQHQGGSASADLLSLSAGRAVLSPSLWSGTID
jgi:hypothetical protein